MPIETHMTANEKQLVRALEKSRREVEKLKGQLRETGTAGQKAGKDTAKAFDESGESVGGGVSKLESYIGMLAGGAGITMAVGKATQAHELWLQTLREISTEATKASSEIIAFAALQEGGTKAARVMEAAGLAQRYGVTERGLAFDTVQALQSAPGSSFERGMASAETVFALSQLGVPLASAKELEVMGLSQGQEPGDAARRAYVAGQESSRDPATIAKAGAAMKFWTDKEVGFAAAGVLSGSVREDELQTYLKRAGIGLSPVGGLQEYMEARGEGGATQLERLGLLHGWGITSPAALEAAGISEIREAEAISDLARGYPEILGIRGLIQERAVPGLLAGEREAVEREIPITQQAREIETLKAMWGDETAFGAAAPGANLQEIEQRQRGLAYRRMGIEAIGPFGSVDAIDEEGHTGPWKHYWVQFMDVLQSMRGMEHAAPPYLRRGVDTDTTMSLLQAEMRNVATELRENTEALRRRPWSGDTRQVTRPRNPQTTDRD